ncbi:MAG: hypothetical protein ABEJ31_11500 [Haloarculaceae archaeon]
MVRSPELWAFIGANALDFVVSGSLTALSFQAYRHSGGQRSYAAATLGFASLLLAGLVEPAYHLLVLDAPVAAVEELLFLQACESILIAIGLALIYYAITHHDTRSSPETQVLGRSDGDVYGAEYSEGDD